MTQKITDPGGAWRLLWAGRDADPGAAGLRRNRRAAVCRGGRAPDAHPGRVRPQPARDQPAQQRRAGLGPDRQLRGRRAAVPGRRGGDAAGAAARPRRDLGAAADRRPGGRAGLGRGVRRQPADGFPPGPAGRPPTSSAGTASCTSRPRWWRTWPRWRRVGCLPAASAASGGGGGRPPASRPAWRPRSSPLPWLLRATFGGCLPRGAAVGVGPRSWRRSC
jgi:hypothetical protein